jgi:hypothetical protein
MILPEQKAQEMLYQASDFAEKAGVTVRVLLGHCALASRLQKALIKQATAIRQQSAS